MKNKKRRKNRKKLEEKEIRNAVRKMIA